MTGAVRSGPITSFQNRISPGLRGLRWEGSITVCRYMPYVAQHPIQSDAECHTCILRAGITPQTYPLRRRTTAAARSGLVPPWRERSKCPGLRACLNHLQHLPRAGNWEILKIRVASGKLENLNSRVALMAPGTGRARGVTSHPEVAPAGAIRGLTRGEPGKKT